MNAPVPASVVVYVNGSSCAQSGTGGADIGSGIGPDIGPTPNGARPALMAAHLAHAVKMAQGAANDTPRRRDPDLAMRDFPSLWRAYVVANFRTYGHVAQVFGVSERTARKWMDGETGCNGRQLARAWREHPDQVAGLMAAAE